MSIPDATPTVRDGAFSTDDLSKLRTIFERACDLMVIERRRLSQRGIELKRANSLNFMRAVTIEERPMVEDLISIFSRSGCHDFSVEMLSPEYCFLLPHCALRVHRPHDSTSRLDLHFDANFLGLEGRAINVWVPLDDLGDGVPGLTFLSPKADPLVLYRAWRHRYDARSDADAAIDAWFDLDEVRALYSHLGEDVFHSPRVRAGGFIAFHQLVPHATEVVPGAVKQRASVEFRIARTSALPGRYRHSNLPIGIWQADGCGGGQLRITDLSGHCM